MYSTRSCLC